MSLIPTLATFIIWFFLKMNAGLLSLNRSASDYTNLTGLIKVWSVQLDGWFDIRNGSVMCPVHGSVGSIRRFVRFLKLCSKHPQLFIAKSNTSNPKSIEIQTKDDKSTGLSTIKIGTNQSPNQGIEKWQSSIHRQHVKQPRRIPTTMTLWHGGDIFKNKSPPTNKTTPPHIPW